MPQEALLLSLVCLASCHTTAGPNGAEIDLQMVNMGTWKVAATSSVAGDPFRVIGTDNISYANWVVSGSTRSSIVLYHNSTGSLVEVTDLHTEIVGRKGFELHLMDRGETTGRRVWFSRGTSLELHLQTGIPVPDNMSLAVTDAAFNEVRWSLTGHLVK